MNGPDLSSLQEPQVRTHDMVRANLLKRKEMGSGDITKMLSYDHQASGEVFYLGTMGYKAYSDWQELRRYEEIQHINLDRTEADPRDTSRSDKHLLANSVYTPDGKPLGAEMTELLLSLPDAGPDTMIMLSECTKNNPPREQLATEVAQLLNKSTLDLIMWRVMMECGLGKVLIDYMSTHSTPEERDAAEVEIAKVSEVVLALGVLWDAEEVAKHTGFTLRNSMKMIEMYGTGDEVIARLEAEKMKLALEESGE